MFGVWAIRTEKILEGGIQQAIHGKSGRLEY